MNNEELIEYLENTSESILPISRTTENRSQDFKRIIHKESKNEKGELLKDIIAFANTNGRSLSCIYCGVDEIGKDVFKISGIEVNLLNDSNSIKDLVKQYIYPPVNIDIITIYNSNLFPNRDKAIQILKIENNSSRPYRFKQTISKKDGYIEGAKYYRVNHSCTPIPTIQEDEIIKKWLLEDAGLVQKIKNNLEWIAAVGLAVDFLLRVPDKYRISYEVRYYTQYFYPVKLIVVSILFSIIILVFFDKSFGDKVNKLFYEKFFLVFKEESTSSEKSKEQWPLKKMIGAYLSVVGLLFYEIIISFIFTGMMRADVFDCFKGQNSMRIDGGNYSDADFISSLLFVILISLQIILMLIPLNPLIRKAFKLFRNVVNLRR
jgi:hypothetical protein